MPDVVVSDFWCKPGTGAADKLNVPSVVNLPAPFSMPDQMGMMSLPNMEETVNCCGLILFKRWLVQGISHILFTIQKNGNIGNLQYAE